MFKENMTKAGSAILEDLQDVIKPLPSNKRERLRANRQAALAQQQSLIAASHQINNNNGSTLQHMQSFGGEEIKAK